MSVGLGKHDISSYLKKGVSIACENSPRNVTLSGELEALEQIIEQLKKEQPGLFVRRLSVKVAYHSGKSLLSSCIADSLTLASPYAKT